MALVTVQRSPSSNDSPLMNTSIIDGLSGQNEMDTSRNNKSLSECYFAGKGTALVLPDAEASTSPQRGVSSGGQRSSVRGTNIQKHLQSMFYLLRPEETLKMAVKLESIHPGRTRYLVVVSRIGTRGEESCLLGIDCNEKTTVGLVLRVLADTSIRLDGDGGFSVSVCGRHHIFKPVSVQAMWSALQSLHKVSSKARDLNYFQAGLTHGWVDYYEDRIESDRSCLNEWHAMDNLESKRPPSPDSIRTKPTEREETERVIRTTLKEIMMSVDLDEVTSKYIRTRLEEELDVDLGEYKSFIDQEMLTILGQMDAPTEIFDHVYLGSEWNASNFEELNKNGVGHILNVTKEIDNFFPGTFDYLNIRVYDDEKTDLLKHWDDTFKYITKARNEGSKVLVHCKMGVSRSASVVIAYAMKAYNWDFKTAWQHVKEKRSCIKPNIAFIAQLETYRGILDAMKNKEKLQRSKSETNLKKSVEGNSKRPKTITGCEPTPIVQALQKYNAQQAMSGKDLKSLGLRPKSWSPDCVTAKELTAVGKSSPIFLSLEDVSQKSSSRESVKNVATAASATATNNGTAHYTPDRRSFLPRHMLMPCDNGESYSVSPNQIVHLPGQHMDFCTTSVKDRINELELNAEQKSFEHRKMLNSNCQNNGATRSEEKSSDQPDSEETNAKHTRDITETWDPGDFLSEKNQNKTLITNENCDCVNRRNSETNQEQQQPVWTSSTVIKTFSKPQPSSCNNSAINNKVPTESNGENNNNKTWRKDSDPFSNILDRVFDKEEKRQQRISVIPVLPVHDYNNTDKRESPSRQNSWSSYDSAVVMGGQTELSRHSSWGSGDTRTLPSRNSSWGSYDIKPSRGPVHYVNEKGEKIVHNGGAGADEVISNKPGDKEVDNGVSSSSSCWWHSGTVRRTRHNLESDSATKKSVETLQQHTDNSENVNHQKDPAEIIVNNNINNNAMETPKFPRTSAIISKCIEIPRETPNVRQKDCNNVRLSLSAPEPSSIMNLVVKEFSLSRCASNGSTISKESSGPNKAQQVHPSSSSPSAAKQHRSFLENKERKHIVNDSTSIQSGVNNNNNKSGIVRNLKREFEAKTFVKSECHHDIVATAVEVATSKERTAKGGSLPSSPISVHVDRPKAADDLNLKNLIGMFEESSNKKRDEQKSLLSPINNRRPKFVRAGSGGGGGAGNNKNNVAANRYSCIEVSMTSDRSPFCTPLIANLQKNVNVVADAEFKRPPVSPVVRKMVAATVIATAAKKQQQYGKSHPLARLNIKPRHNNPVYNTM